MKVVTVDEAERDLSRLIHEALDGEEIVIARGDQLEVRLVPVGPSRPTRSLGWAKGQVTMAPDFDAPLDGFDGHR
jgi:antitoxin (DNA-binding transcriptional repressor) of toxin-antitoxin stability system